MTVLTLHRAALIGVFTIAALFAGTTWSVAGPVTKPDYGCMYVPEANSTEANSAKAAGDVVHIEHCARSDAAGH